MKVNGHGGYWVVSLGPVDNSSAIQGVVAHNATYELLTEVETRQTRSAGCGGWTEGLPRFRRVQSATFFVPEDEAIYPQVIGFTEGRELTVYLKRGALMTFDLLEATLVKSVRVTNDQQKARGVEIVCQHGRLFRSVPVRFTEASGVPITGGLRNPDSPQVQ